MYYMWDHHTCRWYGGPTCNRCHGVAFRQANPSYHKEYQQVQALDPVIKKDRRSRSRKRYWQNKEAIIKERLAYQQNRLQIDPLFKLKRNLRARLNKAIKGQYKAGSAVRDLGCSISELHTYIEKQFKEGMAWSNYGDWHIDHVKPLASFDLSNPEEVKQACHYTNLQPLWEEENLSKSDK